MRDVLILFVHVIVTLVRLARRGGVRSVVAESALVRHQLLILNRGRKRAPNLRTTDPIIAGVCTLFMRPLRILRSAIVLKPSTLSVMGLRPTKSHENQLECQGRVVVRCAGLGRARSLEQWGC